MDRIVELLPFKVDEKKLAKNMILYHIILLVFFCSIAHFFAVFVGIYHILFFLVLSFIFLYIRRYDKNFLNILIIEYLTIIIIILIVNMLYFDYFRNNFNINVSELSKVDGYVYCDKKYYNQIIMNNNLIMYDVFLWNKLMKSNICIPENNNMRIAYYTFHDGFHSDDINLIYDMRDDNEIYIDYEKQAKYYIDIKNKSILFLIISIFLYILLGAITLYFALYISREVDD